MTAADPEVAGLLLAAGAGRRMGRPKAMLVDADGVPRLTRTAQLLLEGGCRSVTVVLGAEAEQARRLLAGHPAQVVVAADWELGMGASLRTGLDALEVTRAVGALVMLVDLPDLTAPVVRRVLDAWRGAGAGPESLVRATYGGRPGHPVLLGRHHWAPLIGSLAGDEGAQPYLRSRKVLEVSCDDLASGRDADRPEDLDPADRRSAR